MRLAIPNKGRLHDPTVDLLEKAGLHINNGADRKLYSETVDPDVTVLYARAGDIPGYVEEGAADAGITGLDQAREAGADLQPLLDLGFGSCRIVVAAPEEDDVDSLQELEGTRIATEFPNISRRHFDGKGVDVDFVEVGGATELTPNAGMADAIVDITSTGTTLEVNNLEVVDEVLESSVYLFRRKDDEDPKIDEVETALRSVKQAEDKRYIMMNVPKDSLAEVKDVIPGMGGPTVMDVEADDGLVAVHAAVDESDIYETINNVKSHGAQDVLVVPIERMMK
ncbi:MAG: ATP phosphoribosyltransferase [Halobacteria archaeon]